MHALPSLKVEPIYESFLTLTPQGFHKLSYIEWGNSAHEEAVVCVHALSRNCHDFDYLAHALEKDYRIVCPDLLGSGASDYLGNPEIYTFSQYLNAMVNLLARLGVQKVHWVGTCLGGILGMMLAAQPGSPIKSLILNDVGMIVPSLPLQRILTFASNDNKFLSFHDAKKYFQSVLAPLGITDPDHWDHLTQHGILRDDKGDFRLAYDPAIARTLSQSPSNLHLEAYWQAIKCPTLVLRGEDSDFLEPEIITKMKYSQPHAEFITIPGCGHSPSLMAPSQIQIVKDWLEKVINKA